MTVRQLDVAMVCDALESQGLMTSELRMTAQSRAEVQRARLLHERAGADAPFGGRQGHQEVDAIDIVASMALADVSDPDRTLSADRITEAVAVHFKIPYVKIDPLKLNHQLITATLSRPFARRHNVVPLGLEGGVLTVAVTDPLAAELFEELRRITTYKLKVVLSPRADIQKIITEVYGFRKSVSAAVEQLSRGPDLGNLEQFVRLKRVDEIEATDKHIVNAVEYILHYAFDQRASDIHIEPKRDKAVVRMRIDGVLHDVYPVPKEVHPAVCSRIKMLARLDIAERRRPQDGRIKTQQGDKEIELRVSTLPVTFGEKIVIRIFDPTLLFKDLSELGFPEGELAQYEQFVVRPTGLILVTGPTGSGKTTTLYSTLRRVAGPEVNVTTIEDPIEMVVDEFNQVAVQPKLDLDFANALRHILRQDPDVIMVGEIRDAETAAYAIQAALTGHLVFSTLHTNDTATSVARLLELGANPYLISSTLAGVVAQRLVRMVCNECRTQRQLTRDEIAALDIQLPPGHNQALFVHEGTGCVTCRNTGLYGRTAIVEVMPINDNIRALINRRADSKEIMRVARADGMATLREAAVRRLALGVTSFAEVIRVTSGDKE
jgi:general secretion pathway protein E